MKKIMFNDFCLLTQAVLDGKKTQTRRIVTYPKTFHGKDVYGFYVCKRVPDGVVTDVCMYDEDESFIDEGQIFPKYKIGEVVAVAQSYKVISENISKNESAEKALFYSNVMKTCYPNEDIARDKEDIAGWDNKMFVKPSLMPHQIRITNVRIQRLQDISDEDCLAEGIIKNATRYCFKEKVKQTTGDVLTFSVNFDTPRVAYAALIDKISGKGTWESNPYVWAYTFELVK